MKNILYNIFQTFLFFPILQKLKVVEQLINIFRLFFLNQEQEVYFNNFSNKIKKFIYYFGSLF